MNVTYRLPHSFPPSSLPPALISINHFSHFSPCKNCQLPIISDYSHLGGGRGCGVKSCVLIHRVPSQCLPLSMCGPGYFCRSLISKMYHLESTVFSIDNTFRVLRIIKYCNLYLFIVVEQYISKANISSKSFANI